MFLISNVARKLGGSLTARNIDRAGAEGTICLPLIAIRLRSAFERRNYDVIVASGPSAFDALLLTRTPDFAVVDLKLAQSSGLSCVETLHTHCNDMIIRPDRLC